MTDKQLIRIAKDMRAGILGKRPSVAMCMAISAPIQGMLSALYGVETELKEVNFPHTNHVFLQLSDGRILDATADQFGLKPIYLGQLPAQYQAWIEETRL